MFAVYGLQGRLSNGPLDRVQSVARLRALAGVQREEQPPPSVVIAGRLAEEGGGGGTGLAAEGLPRQALNAYAQTAAPVRQPLTLTHQLMSRNVVTVSLNASVREAWDMLSRAGVGQAPVVDGQGQLVGLVARAELLRPELLPLDPAEVPLWLDRLAQPVARVMWTPVPSAQPETPLREVAQLLLELGLPGLPVLDDKETLQGFVARSDLLKAMTHEPPLDLWS
jgi:CBS domain-containing protein